jgi:hypothetical protein
MSKPKTMNSELSKLFRAIVQAALLAGTLDISAACLQAYLMNGVPPVRVLHFVASGLFGPSAFTSGMQGAAAGLGLHYLIAYAWTVVFFFLYPFVKKALPKISQNLVVMMIVYGGVVWCVMNLLVLPNSNIPQRPLKPLNASIGAGILMLCIGTPLAWCARRYYTDTPQ